MRTIITPERICIFHTEHGRSQGCVEADFIPEVGSFWVSRMLVQKGVRESGLGTKLMTELCRVLDERQLHAHLVPNPYDETIEFDRLCAFYERFSFTWTPLFMERAPRALASDESQQRGRVAPASQIAL